MWFGEPLYLLNSISLWFFAHLPISVAFRLGDLLCIGIDCPAATWGFGAAMTADDVDSNKASASGNEGIMSAVKREKKNPRYFGGKPAVIRNRKDWRCSLSEGT